MEAERPEPVDLERFFAPHRIAAIGATDTEGSANRGIWQKLLGWGSRRGAEVIPVHPVKDSIDGVRCHRSILDIEGPVDLAAVLVADVAPALEQVVEAGAAFAVVFSAGYAETGPEGARRQAELARIVAGTGTRLLGPNTNLNAFEEFRTDLPGPAIALITQSGHQGRPVYEAQQFGVKVSHWAPTGNEVDLEVAHFVRWFAEQPEVGAIAAYVEGFADGAAFIDAARHAAAHDTPVVLVKVGRTATGASMARSHTGHLTGADDVADAVFRQHGVTRVDGLDELTDVAAMFTRTRGRAAPGRTTGVAIYAISGGTGAHLADLCAAAGLAIPTLSRTTRDALHQWIPGELRTDNPIDSGGHPSMDERGPKILDAILSDPAVDLLICPITGALPALARPLATDLVAAAGRHRTPVFVVWGSPDGNDPVLTEVLQPSGLPLFRTFSNAVTAARAYADRRAFAARRAPRATPRRPATPRTATTMLDAAPVLAEHRAKALLRAYGIPTTDDELCRSAAHAARAAGPHLAAHRSVALKVVSADVLHRSELGLVETGIGSATAVRRTYAQLVARAATVAPDATIDGILVSPMVRGGLECAVGIATDEVFGPVVMFGLGGIFVEALRDVSFRVPPFDRAEARRLVREVEGFGRLDGARGRPRLDVDALVDVLVRVGRLALDQGDRLVELDVNPLLVRPKGHGCIALDAVAVGRPRATGIGGAQTSE